MFVKTQTLKLKNKQEVVQTGNKNNKIQNNKKLQHVKKQPEIHLQLDAFILKTILPGFLCESSIISLNGQKYVDTLSSVSQCEFPALSLLMLQQTDERMNE